MESSRPNVLRTIESQVAPEHTALVIVDVQNDFVHPEGIYGRRTEDLWRESPPIPTMLDRLPGLIGAAREAGCFIVFVRWFGDPQYVSDSLTYLLERNDMYNEICLQGTFGAELYGDIRPIDSPREVVVTKFRYSSFAGSDLDLILRSNGIRTVVVTGVATSACVESTARDAFSADYYLVVISDACADYDAQRHQASLHIMGKSYGSVVQAEDVVNIWSQSRAAVRDTAPSAGQRRPAQPPCPAAPRTFR